MHRHPPLHRPGGRRDLRRRTPDAGVVNAGRGTQDPSRGSRLPAAQPAQKGGGKVEGRKAPPTAARPPVCPLPPPEGPGSVLPARPTSRVPWPMVKQQSMRLEDACILIADCPHSTAPDEGAGYPLVRTPNIGNGRLVFDKMHRVSRPVYELRNKRAKPQAGDLIYAREAPAGNVALITEGQEVCLGQRTVLLRPNPKIVDSAFLTYYLLAPEQKNRLLGTATGATVTHVNIPVIRALEISLPPLPVQRRIADILSAYDDLIENNRRRIAILEETARTVFEEEIANGEWGRRPVDELVEINPEVPKPVCDGIRYVPMSALSTSGMTIDLSEIEVRAQPTSVRFANGDVLLARITPCLENGKTAYVNFLADGEIACGSSEFIVLRGKRVSSFFTYCLARLEAFRGLAIKSMIGASGRQRVQLSCFSDFRTPFPNCATLQHFDSVVEPIFAQIGVLSKQSAKLAVIRDILLSNLMKQG